MKLRLRILAMPLPLVLLLAATASPPQAVQAQSVTDNETVFAELGPTGAVKRVILVDWIRVFGDGRIRVEDAVPGRDAKPLAGTPRPRREDDRLVWEIQVDGASDLFVTASPQRELPMDLAVKYFVDGVEVPAEQAQGSRGKVKVEGLLRNRTSPFVPLLVNVSVALPIASFRSLDSGEGTAVGVGRTVRVSYVQVPRPEARFFYEIDTRRARLPAMQVTVLPQALQEGELADALSRLKDNIDELRGGVLGGLSAGAGGLAAGAGLGAAGASGLAFGGGALGEQTVALGERVRDRVEQSPIAGELARAIGTPDRPGDARALARALGGPDREAGRALGDGLRERIPNLPERGQDVLSRLSGRVPQGPLAQLAAGLAQVQASAQQLQAALARIDQQGFQDLVGELEKAGAQLGTPEEAERARAFDTFTGKPPGATGEVRFVYRVAAPERRVQPARGAERRRAPSLWDRIRDLLPGGD